MSQRITQKRRQKEKEGGQEVGRIGGWGQGMEGRRKEEEALRRERVDLTASTA